jgi:hypothetical protein
MRILASITATLLLTFMLASAPAFTQEDRPDHAQDQSQDKDKNKDSKDKDKSGMKQNDNGRQEEARPEGRENAHPENSRHENPKLETARPQEQTRPEEQSRPEDRRNDNIRRQDQSRPEERGERNQRVANGGRGQRIPEDKFRASFGREHHFRVQRAQIVNQAQPQFMYGGYTFVLQQSWPPEWAFDDDCYVDYVDGDYYLYDLNHPGIQILVFVIG